MAKQAAEIMQSEHGVPLVLSYVDTVVAAAGFTTKTTRHRRRRRWASCTLWRARLAPRLSGSTTLARMARAARADRRPRREAPTSCWRCSASATRTARCPICGWPCARCGAGRPGDQRPFR